jgi:hypothetical protein
VKLPYTVDKPKPYRPSNGTEGAIFMAEFCDRCKREPAWDDKGNPQGEPCPILSAAMAHYPGDTDHPSPAEWIQEGDEARCTAFEPGPWRKEFPA